MDQTSVSYIDMRLQGSPTFKLLKESFEMFLKTIMLVIHWPKIIS